MTASDLTVAVIEKPPRDRLHILLSTWRGNHKVELAEFTPGPINGQFWRSKYGVSLDIAKLPELIEALQSPEAEARRQGLIGGKAVEA
jgi:hypothetical protein